MNTLKHSSSLSPQPLVHWLFDCGLTPSIGLTVWPYSPIVCFTLHTHPLYPFPFFCFLLSVIAVTEPVIPSAHSLLLSLLSTWVQVWSLCLCHHAHLAFLSMLLIWQLLQAPLFGGLYFCWCRVLQQLSMIFLWFLLISPDSVWSTFIYFSFTTVCLVF